jgi:hypothetical protein
LEIAVEGTGAATREHFETGQRELSWPSVARQVQVAVDLAAGAPSDR